MFRGRSMAGQRFLVPLIGVRIPASEFGHSCPYFASKKTAPRRGLSVFGGGVLNGLAGGAGAVEFQLMPLHFETAFRLQACGKGLGDVTAMKVLYLTALLAN